MSETVFSLVTVGIGACIGWFLGRRRTRTSNRVLALVGVLLVVSPLLLFMLASFLENEALGWIAGLSVMIALASAAPLGIGAAVGWTLARRSQRHRPALLADHEPTTQSGSLHHAGPSEPVAPDVPPQRVHTPWKKQRGLLLAMAGVAAGFWVMLAIGFRLNDQQAPSGLGSGLALASLVLITTLALGVRHVWQHQGTSIQPFSFSVRGRRVPRRSDEMAERRAWLAALTADPRRQRYAAMIEAGDGFWTPDRIDYDLDLRATTCCQHLAPIESAIRTAGLPVRMDAIGLATAECRIDADALARQYPLPPSVAYEELVAYDRSLEDPQQARLRCHACGSSLWVHHPDEAAPNTPVFPIPTA